jgi:hypothetical protein
MLAAVPAFAQYNTAHPNGDPQRTTDMNPPASDTAQPSNKRVGSMQGEHGTMMQEHHQAMRGRGQEDTSQNAEVDRLNEQSLQAAQQGRTFNGSGGSSDDQNMSGQPSQPMPPQGSQGSGGGKM